MEQDSKRIKLDESESESESDVSLFIKYLQIRTVHPTPDYKSACDFLSSISLQNSLSSRIVEIIPNKPILIISLKGSDPTLPSVLLNSHLDVVPVEIDKWEYDPFSGILDKDGVIWGRGTQDMKSVGIQHLISVIRLSKRVNQGSLVLKRTVHVSFVPDEEIGGFDGMKVFVQSPEFKELNVGIALDEGIPSPHPPFYLYYSERVPFWFNVTALGPTGHGSGMPLEKTAMEKIVSFSTKVYQIRDKQMALLKQKEETRKNDLGDLTTINMTSVQAGKFTDEGRPQAYNIIPGKVTCGFDTRIPGTIDVAAFKSDLLKLMEEGDLKCEINQDIITPKDPSILDSSKSHWWQVVKNSLTSSKLPFEPRIFPAATDARYIRQQGIPCFGFSPINHVPNLLHDHNEYLPKRVFLKGVDIFETLVADLANSMEKGN